MGTNAPAEVMIEHLRAGRVLIDSLAPRQTKRREGLVTALGIELFGDHRFTRLVTCSVCGCLGDLGDDCGRAPLGHTLAP